MMSTKKFRIILTTDEQQELNALVSRGRAAAHKQTHARIGPFHCSVSPLRAPLAGEG